MRTPLLLASDKVTPTLAGAHRSGSRAGIDEIKENGLQRKRAGAFGNGPSGRAFARPALCHRRRAPPNQPQ
jgi:hypothetical protein